MLRVLGVVLIFSFCIGASANTVELPIYRDWRGNDSQYRSSRPFFIIEDIHHLQRFWESNNSDEPMPFIDFEKAFLFVWHPGPVMHEHASIKVEQFVRQNGSYFLLMSFDQQRSGIWHRPFVATLLPVREYVGDIFVKQIHRRGSRITGLRHLFAIWDMSTTRTSSLEVASLQLPEQRQQQQFVRQPVISKPRSKTERKTSQQKTVSRQTQTVRTAAATPARAAPPAAKASQQSPSRPSLTAAESDPFGGFDDPFMGGATPQTPSSMSSSARTVAPPAMEDDPLFGSEFDIEF